MGLSVQDFKNFLQDPRTSEYLNCEGRLYRELRRLSLSTKTEDPGAVIDIVSAGNPTKYNDKRQHDAGEFYEVMMDKLKEEFNLEGQQIIDTLIQTSVELLRTCCECGFEDDPVTEQVYFHKIPANRKTMEENFKANFETIEQEKRCPNKGCKSTKCQVQRKITRAPPVLAILLQRFERVKNTLVCRKINKAINTPTIFIPDLENPAMFNLKCSVIHKGSVSGGHYFCYIHHPGGKMTRCNDADCQDVVSGREMATAGRELQQAYLLLYFQGNLEDEEVCTLSGLTQSTHINYIFCPGARRKKYRKYRGE